MGPYSDRVEDAENSTENRAQDEAVCLGLQCRGTLSENSSENSFLMACFINVTGMGRCGAKEGTTTYTRLSPKPKEHKESLRLLHGSCPD